MRCLRRSYNKNSAGEVVLCVEESEDLWNIFNIICADDHVTATTFRKVQKETSVGSTSTKVQRTKLTILVTKTEYDSKGNVIRISGSNLVENDYVKKGQFHTIKIELNSELTIFKEKWDYMYLQKLNEALDIQRRAELVVVLIDYGLANIYLVTNSIVKNLFKLQASIPKSRSASTGHNNAINSFFKQLLNGMILHINFDIVNCCIVGGPGFLKEDFLKWMFNELQKLGDTKILKKKSCFAVVKASTAYKHSLNEILTDETLKSKVQNLKCQKDVTCIENFYKILNANPESVCYGPKHVAVAADAEAIDTLLLTDGLFRSSDVSKRLQYVELTEKVKRSGATVNIFSDLHVTGEQLNQITGIAAILRFPVEDLDKIVNEDYALDVNVEEAKDNN